MSLLLEALKKAELAKQQQASQGGGEETTLPITGTRSTDQLRDAPLLEPLMTRDRLPEVDSPLELVPDQIASGDPARGAPLDLTLTDTSPQSTSGARGAAATAAAAATAGAALGAGLRGETTREPRARSWNQVGGPDTASEREAARRIFEAKTPDYNPRRPFYIALGTLGVVAAAAIGYFWWELQPKSNFNTVAKAGPRPVVATPPAQTPPVATTTPTAAAPEPRDTAPQVVAPAPTVPTANINATETTPRAATLPPSGATPRVAPDVAAKGPALAGAPNRAIPQPPQPRLSTQPASAPTLRQGAPVATSTVSVTRGPVARSTPVAAPMVSKTDEPVITRTRPVPRLDPTVEEAYAAFQSGDIERARQLYMRAAQSDSTNRDVQLGLAAIDVHDKNFTNADVRYQRLLELDPRDPHALAGQAALRGTGDPVSTESRLKTLIAQQPESAMLNFVLGNQLATQSRWGEAQQAYFKAFTSDPANPDFAFNLAVSLDNMRQERLAANYYQQALTLADRRPAAFDRTRAATRVKELQR